MDYYYDDLFPCPYCSGSGEGMYDGTTCQSCGGSGEVLDETHEYECEGEEE